MNPQTYLGMRPGDLEGKPYARYWNPEMAELSDEAAGALLHGPFPAAYGFDPDQCHQLLEPGHLPLETGYTQIDSGEIFVAVRT